MRRQLPAARAARSRAPGRALRAPPAPPPSADVSRLSSKLVADSKAFKWSAKRLNLMDRWRKALPFVAAAALLLVLLWWRFG